MPPKLHQKTDEPKLRHRGSIRKLMSLIYGSEAASENWWTKIMALRHHQET